MKTLRLVARFIGFIAMMPAAFASTESIQAVEKLSQLMRQESLGTKVHAGEVLAQFGSAKQVRDVFTEEERQHSGDVGYRTGIWRVLAMAAENPTERKAWTQRIENVFADPAAGDRLAALESLCKLGWRGSADDQKAIRAWRDNATAADAIFADWALALAGDPTIPRLLSIGLSAPEQLTRIRAAYVLKRLRTTDPKILAQLAAAAARASMSRLESAYVQGAALALNVSVGQSDAWKQSLEGVVQEGTSVEAYVAWQGLLGRVRPDEVSKISPRWRELTGDAAIGAAWACLSGDREGRP